jgi:hypothetical protein
MLKITRIQNENALKIHLCGWFTEEYLPEIRRLLDEEPSGRSVLSLDLSNVSFVDRAAMRFLLSAGHRNTSVENCPSYVKRWIEQERGSEMEVEG